MKRNEAANCGNCPYFFSRGPDECDDGFCRRGPKQGTDTHAKTYWCGEHPDFEETGAGGT